MKNIGIIFIVGILMMSCGKSMPDGWYHVQKDETDGIIGEPIVTVDDFTGLKLDSFLIQTTMYYKIDGRVIAAKSKRYIDATEKLVGKQMGFVYKGKIICSPMLNMRLSNPSFSIGSFDRKCILEIYEDIKRKEKIEDPKNWHDVVNVNGKDMTTEEMTAIRATIDSLMNAKDRVVLPDRLVAMSKLPDSIMQNDSIMTDPNFSVMKYYTHEQKTFHRQVANVFLDGVKLEGNRMVVSISREEVAKRGLPKEYYDYFVQSVNDMNVFRRIYKKSPESLEADWTELMQNYKKILDSRE